MQSGAHILRRKDVGSLHPSASSGVTARYLHWLSRSGLGRTRVAKIEPFKGFKSLTSATALQAVTQKNRRKTCRENHCFQI